MKYFISYSVVRSYGDTPEIENEVNDFRPIESHEDILCIQDIIAKVHKFHDVKIVNYKAIQ